MKTLPPRHQGEKIEAKKRGREEEKKKAGRARGPGQ